MKSYIPALPLLIVAVLLAGCISSHTTTYNDVERVKVSFASERAGRVFYETLSRLPRHEREESRNEVSLILIDVERRTVTGPNKFFNDAVARCDTDHDGIITEEEAQIFAASVKAGS